MRSLLLAESAPCRRPLGRHLQHRQLGEQCLKQLRRPVADARLDAPSSVSSLCQDRNLDHRAKLFKQGWVALDDAVVQVGCFRRRDRDYQGIGHDNEATHDVALVRFFAGVIAVDLFREDLFPIGINGSNRPRGQTVDLVHRVINESLLITAISQAIRHLLPEN